MSEKQKPKLSALRERLEGFKRDYEANQADLVSSEEHRTGLTEAREENAAGIDRILARFPNLRKPSHS